MTQEIEQKLEQALADRLTNYIKQRHDQSRCVGYSDGVLAGTQTILENPVEWGLRPIDKQEVWGVTITQLTTKVSEQHLQLAKYREALEVIKSECDPNNPTHEKIWRTAFKATKEVLKQEG